MPSKSELKQLAQNIMWAVEDFSDSFDGLLDEELDKMETLISLQIDDIINKYNIVKMYE